MSSVPDSEKPAWPPGQAQPAEYTVAQETSQPTATPAAAGSQRPGWWYVPRSSGKREGPIPLDALKQRFAAGSIAADDLVWREGMPEWLAARLVPELGARPSAGGPPPFSTAPAAAPIPLAKGPTPAELLQQAQGLFAQPMLYRMAGFACGALGVLLLAVSFIVWAAGGATSHLWFIDALIMALVFVVGQATAAILDKIDHN